MIGSSSAMTIRKVLVSVTVFLSSVSSVRKASRARSSVFFGRRGPTRRFANARWVRHAGETETPKWDAPEQAEAVNCRRDLENSVGTRGDEGAIRGTSGARTFPKGDSLPIEAARLYQD